MSPRIPGQARGFEELLNEATGEVTRMFMMAQENALRDAATRLGLSLSDVAKRLALHVHSRENPPWFVVYDSVWNCEVSPRLYWYFKENVFYVSPERPEVER